MQNKLIIKTTDIYEVAYYLSDASTVIEGVEVLPRGKQKICQFALSGCALDTLQQLYLTHEATVNVFEFRKLYCQVNVLIGKARKDVEIAEHISESEACRLIPGEKEELC